MNDTGHTRVLVTGADGFLGRHLVVALASSGFRVKAMSRRREGRTADAAHEVAIADMRDSAAVRAAVNGCSVVVHLAAATGDTPDAHDINVLGARNLVDACRASGCRKLVVFSTLSVRIPVKGTYASTKAEADEVFRHAGLDATILYPSLIYSNGEDGLFGALTRIVEQSRWIPVLGNGRWLSAPVHVADVADAVIACLHLATPGVRAFDIAGPEARSFDDLLDSIAASKGLARPRKLHVPMPLALAVARALARVMQRPPFSVSNVLGSNQDVPIDIEPARRDLGFRPRTLAAGLVPQVPTHHRVAVLLAEAAVLSKHLVGVHASGELARRYADAHRRLLDRPADSLTAFARRHPVAVPCLDAVTGVLGHREGFRQRLLLMATVLEASPDHAAKFQPPPRRGRMVTEVWRAAVPVVTSAVLAAIGLPLFLWLRHRGRG